MTECRSGEVLNFPEEILSVPGTHITDQQARLYMNLRRTHTRQIAAAKAGFSASTGGRPRKLAGLEEWITERFRQHAGNADVVRQVSGDTTN